MGPSFRTLFLTWPSLPSLTPSARLQNPGFLAPSGPGLKFISPGLLSGLRDPLSRTLRFLPLQGQRSELPCLLTPSGSRIRTPLSFYPSGQGSELHFLTPSGSRIRTPSSAYPFRVKDQNSLVCLPPQGQGTELPCLLTPAGSMIRTPLSFLPPQGQGSELPCLLTPAGSRIRTPLSFLPLQGQAYHPPVLSVRVTSQNPRLLAPSGLRLRPQTRRCLFLMSAVSANSGRGPGPPAHCEFRLRSCGSPT